MTRVGCDVEQAEISFALLIVQGAWQRAHSPVPRAGGGFSKWEGPAWHLGDMRRFMGILMRENEATWCTLPWSEALSSQGLGSGITPILHQRQKQALENQLESVNNKVAYRPRSSIPRFATQNTLEQVFHCGESGQWGIRFRDQGSITLTRQNCCPDTNCKSAERLIPI